MALNITEQKLLPIRRDGQTPTTSVIGSFTIGCGTTYTGSTGCVVSCLDELSDVIINTPTTNQLLQYNGSTWCNTSTTALSLTSGCPICYNGTALVSYSGGSGGAASCLDALTDVVVSTPSNGHILTYTGGTWCNKPTTALSLTTGCIVCYNGTTLTNVGTIAASALPIASASCLGGIRIGTGLSIDGSGIVCTTAGSTVGYALVVHAANLATVADACTYYFGSNVLAPIVTADRSRVYIPKTGAIKSAVIFGYSSTAGTGEAWTMCIRKNNTTDTLVQSLSCASSSRLWCNTGLNISVNAGDYIEMKTVFPTWATNPANLCLSGHIYIE